MRVLPNYRGILYIQIPLPSASKRIAVSGLIAEGDAGPPSAYLVKKPGIKLQLQTSYIASFPVPFPYTACFPVVFAQSEQL